MNDLLHRTFAVYKLYVTISQEIIYHIEMRNDIGDICILGLTNIESFYIL